MLNFKWRHWLRFPLPECTPMRINRGIPGMCCNSKVPKNERMSRAMWAMSTACLLPLRLGKPDATMYASPIVSTWETRMNEWTEILTSICENITRCSAVAVPYRHHGGRGCCQSSCRCCWACRPPPWGCCSGRGWWIRQCHWNRWSPPQTALAPLCPSPSKNAPRGWGHTKTTIKHYVWRWPNWGWQHHHLGLLCCLWTRPAR